MAKDHFDKEETHQQEQDAGETKPEVAAAATELGKGKPAEEETDQQAEGTSEAQPAGVTAGVADAKELANDHFDKEETHQQEQDAGETKPEVAAAATELGKDKPAEEETDQQAEGTSEAQPAGVSREGLESRELNEEDVLESTIIHPAQAEDLPKPPQEADGSQPEQPWGWWRIAVPVEDHVSLRQVVRYKDGVQIGPARLERVANDRMPYGGYGGCHRSAGKPSATQRLFDAAWLQISSIHYLPEPRKLTRKARCMDRSLI